MSAGKIASARPAPVVGDGRSAHEEEALPVVTKVAPFPLAVLPALVQVFVNEVAEAMASDVDFVAVGALAVASAALGSTRCVEARKGHMEHGNLIVVALGEPGTKKTPALKKAMAPLFEAEQRVRAEHQRRMRDEPGNPAGIPEPVPTYIVSDVTTEALAEVLQENPRGVLYVADEMTAWVAAMNQYRQGGKGSDRQKWLSIYSGATLSIRRSQRRAIYVPRPFVTLLGGAQPDVVGRLIGGQNDGFADRLLFAYPSGRRFGVSRKEITEDATSGWGKVVDELLSLRHDEGEPVVMNLTTRALDAFEAWNVPFFAAAENGDIPVFLEGVAAKAPGTVLRLALVLESMAWAAGEPGRGTAITEEAVQGAIVLFTYFFAHAERVYRQYRADAQDARVTRLLQWLANRNRKVVKPREVVQSGVAGLTKTADARELMVRAAAASGGACVFSVGDAAMTVDIAQLKRVLHPT